MPSRDYATYLRICTTVSRKPYYPPLYPLEGAGIGHSRWSAGFLGEFPFPPPFHSCAVPYSPRCPHRLLRAPHSKFSTAKANKFFKCAVQQLLDGGVDSYRPFALKDDGVGVDIRGAVAGSWGHLDVGEGEGGGGYLSRHNSNGAAHFPGSPPVTAALTSGHHTASTLALVCPAIPVPPTRRQAASPNMARNYNQTFAVPIADLITLLEELIPKFSVDLVYIRHPHNAVSDLKQNLGDDEILTHIDFCANMVQRHKLCILRHPVHRRPCKQASTRGYAGAAPRRVCSHCISHYRLFTIIRLTNEFHDVLSLPASARQRKNLAIPTVSSLRYATYTLVIAGMQGRGKRETTEKTRRPAASSGTIPTYENPGVNQPGIKPGSPWWEASRLTAQSP
ncbi:hypothetical protein PR048_032142 [Dryococelus australis]|uniref:RNase H type-1 domain-containing protein n=1 Tax=Dryococelus australis TaxID=614101 RepID=A0ABQ9G1E2_9NEOP|nr:hypothetical protein PR048_032142 [Dryococelus australis]